jgi:hypothetical protein
VFPGLKYVIKTLPPPKAGQALLLKLNFIHIFTENNTFEILFRPGRSLILPQIKFLLNNLSFFCGRILDDNEFKVEMGGRKQRRFNNYFIIISVFS